MSMANLDTEFFSIPVTGNIGVRMVETDQYASDLTDVGGDATLGAQNITDAAGLVNTRYKPGIIGQTYQGLSATDEPEFCHYRQRPNLVLLPPK